MTPGSANFSGLGHGSQTLDSEHHDVQCKICNPRGVMTSWFVNFPGVKCVCLHDHEIQYLVVYENLRGSANWNQNYENPHHGKTSGTLVHAVLGPNATKTMEFGAVNGLR